jgi:hypothetical protein
MGGKKILTGALALFTAGPVSAAILQPVQVAGGLVWGFPGRSVFSSPR